MELNFISKKELELELKKKEFEFEVELEFGYKRNSQGQNEYKKIDFTTKGKATAQGLYVLCVSLGYTNLSNRLLIDILVYPRETHCTRFICTVCFSWIYQYIYK